MRKLLILSLIASAVLGDESKAGDFTFEWKSSSLFPNGTVVQACVGENVTLPWVLDMTSPKNVSIEWSKTSEDQEKGLVLASYSGDTFYGLVPERGLKFLPNAGIMLPKVSLADTGMYKVEIIVLGHPQLYKQVAFLHVSDVPVTTSDELHAFILPESVYNSTTGLWHVQLGCRPPVTRGQSALPVIWTTPSNRTVISTSYYNTTFILALPSPMEEGDYSCSLNRSVPAVKCLSTLLNTSRAATVKVKGVNTRLSSLEESVEALCKKTDELNGSVSHFTDIVLSIRSNDKRCDEEIINLNHTTENINSVLQNLPSKTDHMTRAININTDEYIHAASAISESQTKNENLKSEFNWSQCMTANLLQSKLDNITAMIRSNNDSITAMVQNRFDIITAMVQSKFDNVIAIVLQMQSDIIKHVFKDDTLRPTSCDAVKKYNGVSGIHTIFLSKGRNITVYCDQSTDNGGWTVIQRRQDGSVDFYRNWEQYETGFGDLNGEFWIGLANLYYLTTNKNYKLRVDITDFDGSTAYAMYNTFSISGAQDNYRLNVGGYTGTAGDSLASHNNMQFSTLDKDHDTNDVVSCAQFWHGAWWYATCHVSHLNGRYKFDGAQGADGVNWFHWKTNWRSYKRVEMKIKQ